jgi:hypothetical protein
MMAEICLCGRLRTRVHCPFCGSYTVLGYAKRDKVNRGDGRIEEIRSFRCRRCSEIFNDDKWQFECNAPLLGSIRPNPAKEKPLKKKKPNEPILDTLKGTPTEMMLSLNKFLASEKGKRFNPNLEENEEKRNEEEP